MYTNIRSFHFSNHIKYLSIMIILLCLPKVCCICRMNYKPVCRERSLNAYLPWYIRPFVCLLSSFWLILLSATRLIFQSEMITLTTHTKHTHSYIQKKEKKKKRKHTTNSRHTHTHTQKK